MADHEVATIPIGTDVFAAEVLVAACRAEGIHVELVTANSADAAIGVPQTVEHNLLVHPDDVPAVQQIIEQSTEE